MRKALVSLTLILASAFFSFSQNYSSSISNFAPGCHLRTYSIQFELGKGTIQSTSHPFLDSLATLLTENPYFRKIEICVHTDTRVSAAGSTKLSELRAKAICDYLITKGISADRLLPKGYQGVSQLIPDKQIASMKTLEEKEAAHQKNRRVEFKILSI